MSPSQRCPAESPWEAGPSSGGGPSRRRAGRIRGRALSGADPARGRVLPGADPVRGRAFAKGAGPLHGAGPRGGGYPGEAEPWLQRPGGDAVCQAVGPAARAVPGLQDEGGQRVKDREAGSFPSRSL